LGEKREDSIEKPSILVESRKTSGDCLFSMTLKGGEKGSSCKLKETTEFTVFGRLKPFRGRGRNGRDRPSKKKKKKKKMGGRGSRERGEQRMKIALEHPARPLQGGGKDRVIYFGWFTEREIKRDWLSDGERFTTGRVTVCACFRQGGEWWPRRSALIWAGKKKRGHQDTREIERKVDPT